MSPGRHTVIAALAGALAAAVLLLLETPLAPLNDQAAALQYRVRGARLADSSIVLIYVDDASVKELGWPVKRNFYALMIKVLNDLKVRAVGIEPVFEDRRPEYSEYDHLLADVAASAGNVVLGAYFDSVADREDPSAADTVMPAFSFPQVEDVPLHGISPHFPYQPLFAAAAGVGHLNLTDDRQIPVFLAYGKNVVPSFDAEILRVALGTDRPLVRWADDEVAFLRSQPPLRFSLPVSGTVRLNFPGSVSSFLAYPFLEVLKSYDALKSERPPAIPLARLKGKIALIGVVAEGRSQFLDTPVDRHLPSLALHGTFLDDALGAGFEHKPDGWLKLILLFVVGGAAAFTALRLRSPFDKAIPAALLLLVALLSQLLFGAAHLALPLASLLVAGAMTAVASLLYKHQLVQRRVDHLEANQAAVVAQLREKEEKLMVVEREFLALQGAKGADRTADLLNEIRKYKAEIRMLSSRADDMEEYRELPEIGADEAAMFDGIVYDRGGKMKPVIEFVSKIASSDAPVLILGESGTGKELVARAIHRRSGRVEGPFVAVNCGALTESLLESELFGHEKGAFTGAVKDRLGRFELAHGGTIFLDEIGEVSEAFQLKLLRVLQEGELERVGGSRVIKVDVRVLAATNKDLKELVSIKKFREDLYYRLNVLTVSLPPLRERDADIPLLIRHFLQREGNGTGISRNAMDALQHYPWPGNVRELESAVKRAVLLARADNRGMIAIKDLTEEVAAAAQEAIALEEQVLESLREKKFSRSSISDTASELGDLNRGTVAEYLRGECLKAFSENRFDLTATVRHIALSADPETRERVQKKLQEYLRNIFDAIDTSQPWDEARQALRPKLKNLPQRYHRFVEEVGEACHRRLWKPL